jgi:hypothetical protein
MSAVTVALVTMSAHSSLVAHFTKALAVVVEQARLAGPVDHRSVVTVLAVQLTEQPPQPTQQAVEAVEARPVRLEPVDQELFISVGRSEHGTLCAIV